MFVYGTFLGYDEVTEQILEKQGEATALEDSERYRYKCLPNNLLTLKH